jgi:tetratricopeptide (TPR) repeat protein
MPTDSEENEQESSAASEPSRKLRMDYVLAAVIVLVVVGFMGREWLGGSNSSADATATATSTLSEEAQTGFKDQTNAGLARYQEGKYAEAEAAFRKSTEYAPQSALGYNNLGSALNAQSKFDEAIPVLQKAVTLDPSLALARNNLGFALSSKAKQGK